jgi:hypothetical protein
MIAITGFADMAEAAARGGLVKSSSGMNAVATKFRSPDIA